MPIGVFAIETILIFTKMKQTFLKISLLLLSVFFLQSCIDDTDIGDTGNDPNFIFAYTFGGGQNDWVDGITEYPLYLEDSLQYTVEMAEVPSSITTEDSLLRVSFVDSVGETFTFLKIQVGELSPSTVFDVELEIELAASNLDAAGTTYDDDMEVHVKAGVFENEPTIIDADDSEFGFETKVLDIDKGNNTDAGDDMVFLGTLQMPEPRASTALARGNNSGNLLRASTDAGGNMWLLIGLDSETKMHQAYYYSKITVFYYEVAQ